MAGARPGDHVYRIGKVPRNLVQVGDQQENRFGRLGREYGKIVFDKKLLTDDPTLEWVTRGHPLFEAVRSDVLRRTEDHLRRGAVFYDLHRKEPALLDVFGASIKDGRGNTLHRRLFVVETNAAGEMSIYEPTVFHEITPAPTGTTAPDGNLAVPHRQAVEQFLYQQTLQGWGTKTAAGTDARFWKLAQSLSALYPAGSDEKRWVDSVLARKKGLGL